MELAHDITELLYKTGRLSRSAGGGLQEGLEFLKLAPDGSTRRFLRVRYRGEPLCLAVAPAAVKAEDIRESRSVWHIGRHLEARGMPVPEMYAWNKKSGLVLFEDLGDTQLFDRLTTPDGTPKDSLCEEEQTLYRRAVELLAVLQVKGGEDFDTSWCWDSKRYDKNLMLTREFMYFLASFWADMLGGAITPELMEEGRELARLADDKEDFFLHRDFQSRNLMVCQGKLRIIDFQGGRCGPRGYDLASLLIDPYVALSEGFQEEMLRHYMETMEILLPGSLKGFRRSYAYLALQRNLQILGAFSFLSRKRKKDFFAQFISPSLHMLQRRLNEDVFNQFTALRDCVEQAVALMRKMPEEQKKRLAQDTET